MERVYVAADYDRREFWDRVKTVQIALTSFRNEGEIFWNQLMAATLVVTAVVGVIFLCLQNILWPGLWLAV